MIYNNNTEYTFSGENMTFLLVFQRRWITNSSAVEPGKELRTDPYQRKYLDNLLQRHKFYNLFFGVTFVVIYFNENAPEIKIISPTETTYENGSILLQIEIDENCENWNYISSNSKSGTLESNTTNIILNEFKTGNYTINVSCEDNLSNIGRAEVNFEVNFNDGDLDGVEDGVDTLIGSNEYTFKINENSSKGTFNESKNVSVYDGNKKILEFVLILVKAL
jgi:hypothetical protein